MALSSSSDVHIAEVVIYLLLLPLTAYLGWKHGRHGLMGYFYLNIFCAVRVASDIISLLPANRNAGHPTIATAVLSSVGLSPLLLALAGFIHEAHLRHLSTTTSAAKVKSVNRWLAVAQLQVHAVAILGMVLVIIGSINLYTPGTVLDATQMKHDDSLRTAGMIMLLVVWVVLGQYACYLCYVTQRARASPSSDSTLAPLVVCIVVAVLFAGIRCIYSVVSVLDHTDEALNPITGALWVQVVFIFLIPLLAILALTVGGWISKDAGNDAMAQRGSSMESTVD